MSTEKPIRVHDVPGEVRRLQEETRRLVDEIEIRGRTTALMLRARDLRKRAKSVGKATERLLKADAAASIAFMERTGRGPIDGDEITGADVERANRIVEAEEMKAGRC